MSVKENEKKKDFSDFFFIFQLLEIMKKKIFYKEKRKKKNLVQILNGLLPNCIFKEGNCIAILDFVLQRFRLEKLKVYCNEKDCIAGWFGWGGRLCHDTNIVS